MTISERFTSTANRVLRGLTDTLIPPVCLACQKPLADHDAICAACWSGVAFIRPPLCDRLGIPLPFDPRTDAADPIVSAAALADPPNYDRARAAAHYDGVVRNMIHALKYNDRHDARRLFGRWLKQAGEAVASGFWCKWPVPVQGGDGRR
jgi:predicted amidophosphoribosyltransferase